jgi:hypothetical protein
MRGTILNWRSFILEEPASVFIRAAANTVVMELSFDDLISFLKESFIYEKKLLSH